MKAWVLTEKKQPLQWQEMDDVRPGSGEVVVSLHAAALNRRDYWITQGMYPGIRTPVILGSDGAGVVTDVGSKVDSSWQGTRVLINPGWEWGDDPAVQADTFVILGMPHNGTLATQVVVPARYIHRVPEHLSSAAAAALPLAGLTAYRGLFTQGGLQSGQRVLITGVGGGVASTALLLARAAGAEVFATSSDPSKRTRAETLGAQQTYDYRSEGWHKQLQRDTGGMDLVLDGAGGAGFNDLLDVLRPGGRLVNYGATAGPPAQLDLFRVFWKQLQIVGSTMGSPADFEGMLRFVTKHRIEPCVDREVPLPEAAKAVAAMGDAPQFGKTVVTMV